MENLFESLNHQDSVFFLLSMLISFLIGFIAAWAMWRGAAMRYQREAADWKKKHDDLAAELTAVREKLDLSTADLAKAKREAEIALEETASFQKEKLKWQKDLDQSLEETVRLHASAHSYQATIEELHQQVNYLQAQNASMTEQAASGQSEHEKLAAMQTSYGASMEQVGALEARIAQLTTENEALKVEGKKEDENLLNLLKSYNDTTNRLGTLEEKIGSLVAENEALKAELDGLKNAASDGAIMGAAAIVTSINPADKEAITGGTIAPSDAKNEVLAAIGSSIPTATADQKDDLTQIKGIGSFLEKKLNALGIYTFEQISRFDAGLIDNVTAAIEFFPGRIERDDWVGQAKKLAEDSRAIKANDLKVVEGIGPKIEKILFDAGIQTLSDLANASVEHLKEVLNKAGDRYRIHDPSTWPEQAKLAAAGELEKLKEYQDFLSGGKEPGQ